MACTDARALRYKPAPPRAGCRHTRWCWRARTRAPWQLGRRTQPAPAAPIAPQQVQRPTALQRADHSCAITWLQGHSYVYPTSYKIGTILHVTAQSPHSPNFMQPPYAASKGASEDASSEQGSPTRSMNARQAAAHARAVAGRALPGRHRLLGGPAAAQAALAEERAVHERDRLRGALLRPARRAAARSARRAHTRMQLTCGPTGHRSMLVRRPAGAAALLTGWRAALLAAGTAALLTSLWPARSHGDPCRTPSACTLTDLTGAAARRPGGAREADKAEALAAPGAGVAQHARVGRRRAARAERIQQRAVARLRRQVADEDVHARRGEGAGAPGGGRRLRGGRRRQRRRQLGA